MSRRGLYRPTYRDKRTGETKTSAVWWASFMQGDKRVRMSTGFSNVKDAEAFLDERRAERHATTSGLLPPTELRKVTVERLLDLVRQRYITKRNRSVVKADGILDNLSACLGHRTASTVTADDVTGYIAWRHESKGRRLADSTLAREINMLVQAYRLGQKRGLVRDVPDFSDVTPAESAAREDFFSDSEIVTMVAALPEDFRALVEIAAICGWRRSALLSRKVSDVQDGFLLLDRSSSKNSKPYRFPVGGRVAELLERQDERRRAVAKATGRLPEHIFFDSETGAPLTPGQLRYRWAKAQEATKIGHTFHGLRRTAARNMVRRGISQRAAQDLLGMETDEIFVRYSIVDETVLEEAAALLYDSAAQAEPERKIAGAIHSKVSSKSAGRVTS
jgi:integrase